MILAHKGIKKYTFLYQKFCYSVVFISEVSRVFSLNKSNNSEVPGTKMNAFFYILYAYEAFKCIFLRRISRNIKLKEKYHIRFIEK